MTTKSTRERIVGILEDQLGLDPEDVKDDSSLIEDLGADSLDMVEIVMAAEEEFDLELPDDDELEKIKTVKDMVEFIDRKKAAA